ncbi:MAG TPA: alpha/beta hydrolase [bacterium]|nr:alpha/beta hydrolase [bacterium]
MFKGVLHGGRGRATLADMLQQTVIQRQEVVCRTRNENGGQTPALFVHGAGSEKDIWLFVSHYVAEKLPDKPLLLLDLPGHGDSEPPGRQSVEEYAAIVSEFLTANRLGPVDIIGHSMGGLIAQATALAQPRLVRKLCLVATGARLKVLPLIFELLPDQAEAFYNNMQQFAFGPSIEKKLAEKVIDRMRHLDPLTIRGDFTACDAFDARERLGEIFAPTLVVAGDQDLLAPAKINHKLADGLPFARYVELAETGHMIPIERPMELAEHLCEHFEA